MADSRAPWFVSVRYRLATGETADCVRQNIKSSEAGHNLIYESLGALTSRNLCW